MGLKENVKKSFENRKTITQERYKSTKFVFIILGFLFFVNFFFVGAGFYKDFFILTLPFSYTLFLFIFCFYLYFYIKKTLLENFNMGFKIFISSILILLFIVFLFPFFIEGGIYPFLKEYLFPVINKILELINK